MQHIQVGINVVSTVEANCWQEKELIETIQTPEQSTAVHCKRTMCKALRYSLILK